MHACNKRFCDSLSLLCATLHFTRLTALGYKSLTSGGHHIHMSSTGGAISPAPASLQAAIRARHPDQTRVLRGMLDAE